MMEAVHGETKYGTYAVVYDRNVTIFTRGGEAHTRSLERAVHWAPESPAAGLLADALEDAHLWEQG